MAHSVYRNEVYSTAAGKTVFVVGCSCGYRSEEASGDTANQLVEAHRAEARAQLMEQPVRGIERESKGGRKPFKGIEG